MGESISLTASDGFEQGAWEAKPADGSPRGGIVVVQEIFGVNQHIREVADGFAAAGYAAVAPAVFDRVEPGVELGYDEQGMTRGVEIARGKLDHEKTMLDLQAAIDHAGQYGRVGIVGYCFGGLMAWLCANRASGLDAAVGYYGGGIAGFATLQPAVPTMLHFGDQDAHIPLSDVEKIRAAQPEVEVHVYEADHGFNCDHRGSYNEAAAQLARSRTLAFFHRYL